MIRVTFVSQILYFSTIDLLGDNWYLCRKSWQYSFGAEPFSILKNRLLEIERRRGVISVGRLPPSAVISGKIIVPRGTISEANVILGVHLSPWKFDSWSKNWCNSCGGILYIWCFKNPCNDEKEVCSTWNILRWKAFIFINDRIWYWCVGGVSWLKSWM